jgi:hypothetical protein
MAICFISAAAERCPQSSEVKDWLRTRFFEQQAVCLLDSYRS